MDPELKQLMEANMRLAQENNDLLRAIRRQAQWGFWGKVVLYALVIIVPLFFIQSYLAPYQELLNPSPAGASSDSSTSGLSGLDNLIKEYNATTNGG
jgi:hypothetical protein